MGETTMRLALIATIDRPRVRKTRPARVRLTEGDVYRVPRQIRHLQVVSGRAWVSFAGEDILLAPGQQLAFTAFAHHTSNGVALVSCLDQAPVVFEMAKK